MPSEMPTKEQLERWAHIVGNARHAWHPAVFHELGELDAFLRSDSLARALEALEAYEVLDRAVGVAMSNSDYESTAFRALNEARKTIKLLSKEAKDGA